MDLDGYEEDNADAQGMLKTNLKAEFQTLCDRPRVWVLVSDIRIRQPTETMLTLLDQFGPKLDKFEVDKAASFVQLREFNRCTK